LLGNVAIGTGHGDLHDLHAGALGLVGDAIGHALPVVILEMNHRNAEPQRLGRLDRFDQAKEAIRLLGPHRRGGHRPGHGHQCHQRDDTAPPDGR